MRPGPRASQRTHPAVEPFQPRASSASAREANTTTTISVAPEVEVHEMHARSAHCTFDDTLVEDLHGPPRVLAVEERSLDEHEPSDREVGRRWFQGPEIMDMRRDVISCRNVRGYREVELTQKILRQSVPQPPSGSAPRRRECWRRGRCGWRPHTGFQGLSIASETSASKEGRPSSRTYDAIMLLQSRFVQ